MNKLLLFFGIVLGLSLFSACSKTSTKFVVLGFELNIEDEKEECISSDQI